MEELAVWHGVCGNFSEQYIMVIRMADLYYSACRLPDNQDSKLYPSFKCSIYPMGWLWLSGLAELRRYKVESNLAAFNRLLIMLRALSTREDCDRNQISPRIERTIFGGQQGLPV